MTLAELPADERRLIEIVRSLKSGTGFGEFIGSVNAREIVNVKRTENFKLKT